MDRLEHLIHGGGISESSKSITDRLEAARLELEQKKKDLLILQNQKAIEAANPNPSYRGLESFDEQIEPIKKRIEELPKIIGILEQQLDAANTEGAEKKKVFDEYKKTINLADMKVKSTLLEKQLKAALKTNEEILEFHRERILMAKKTGYNLEASQITGGFRTLKLLFDVCEAENRGEPRKFTRLSMWAQVFGDEL